MPFVYKQCFIQYQAKIDGSPAHGYVEFTPNTTLMDTNSIAFSVDPIVVKLDDNGRVDVSLLSNDNVDIFPDNWSWTIQEKIEGGGLWWFQLDEAMPEPVDLKSLYPLDAAPPTIVNPGTPGQSATIAVGSTATGAPGTPANVNNSGNQTNAILDFTIPKGEKGDSGEGVAASVDVGSTTTGAPGTNANVVNSGDTVDAILDFTIPRGDTGDANAPHIGDTEPVDPAIVEWFDTSEVSVRGVANSGDTMTGPLILSGDATDPLGAVTKQQLDAGGGGGGSLDIQWGDEPTSPTEGMIWVEMI